MCQHDHRALTFETMLSDPLIRLMMESDGVSLAELVEVLEVARAAVAAREAMLINQWATISWCPGVRTAVRGDTRQHREGAVDAGQRADYHQ